MSSLYEKYNLKQVINASGRMTILGVSTPRAEVAEVVNYGLNHFFEMKDLVNKTGAYIAKMLNVENAVVVSCASSGIAQSVAAVIVKDDAWLLENLHAVPLNVPLIVDAAAEEDLTCYYQMGASLVIYSGAKAIEGPTSGLVLGKHQYVEWVKLQSNGIGRAMKVGKEGILGLTQAIESYTQLPKTTGQEMVDKMTPFIDSLNKLNGVSARVVWDSAGRDIARTEIAFDEAALGWKTKAIVDALKTGEIAIYFRGYRANEGKIEVDVRSVTPPQLEIIAQCIKQLFA